MRGQSMKLNRTIEVFKILLQKSNEQNPITMSEILEELSEVGLTANRKTIYNDFKLIEMQTPCEVIPTKGARANYYLSDGIFEVAEVRLLTDAVLCSKFINPSRSKKIIEKFERLISVYDREMLGEQNAIEKMGKSSNMEVLNNVDKIYKALASKRSVSFQYFDYNWKHERVLRRGGRSYRVRPLFLMWADNKYYMMSNISGKSGEFVYRIDRMVNILLEKIELDYIETSVDIASYSKEVFSMYSSEQKRKIVLTIDNSDGQMINQIYDKFGEEVQFEQANKEEWYKCELTIDIAVTFFAWLSQYEGKIVVTEPTEVKEQYLAFLQNNLDGAKLCGG